jgi:hypothetical protein
MIVDVCTSDLEVAEASFGPFHATTWHFRNMLAEARRSWDRLRAELGSAALEAALQEAPLTVLTLHNAIFHEDREGRRTITQAHWTTADTPFPKNGSDAENSRNGSVVLVPIAGRTYCVERIAGTPLAPVQWRLTHLRPPADDGPYFACRLDDGSTQCDCAEWTYRIASNGDAPIHCKHLAALAALGWL